MRKLFKQTSQKIFVALLTVLCLAGCSYVTPYIRDINVISVSQEQSLATQMSSEVAKTVKITTDPGTNNRVASIGNRLVAALPKRDFNYSFQVVQDSSPNAFTIPGGKIYIHTGTLNFVDDDNELAGVIAHEIGHAYKRHPAKAMTRQYGAAFLSNLIVGKQPSELKKIAAQVAAGGILQAYGRDDEFEADDVAFYILDWAGYPTDGLLRFFKKLEPLEKGKTPPKFLSTHPPTAERIARLEAREQGPNFQTSTTAAK